MNDQYQFLGKIPGNSQPQPLTANKRIFHLSLISITLLTNTQFNSYIKSSSPRNKVISGTNGLTHNSTSHFFPTPWPLILVNIILGESDLCFRSLLSFMYLPYVFHYNYYHLLKCNKQLTKADILIRLSNSQSSSTPSYVFERHFCKSSSL